MGDKLAMVDASLSKARKSLADDDAGKNGGQTKPQKFMNKLYVTDKKDFFL